MAAKYLCAWKCALNRLQATLLRQVGQCTLMSNVNPSAQFDYIIDSSILETDYRWEKKKKKLPEYLKMAKPTRVFENRKMAIPTRVLENLKMEKPTRVFWRHWSKSHDQKMTHQMKLEGKGQTLNPERRVFCEPTTGISLIGKPMACYLKESRNWQTPEADTGLKAKPDCRHPFQSCSPATRHLTRNPISELLWLTKKKKKKMKPLTEYQYSCGYPVTKGR